MRCSGQTMRGLAACLGAAAFLTACVVRDAVPTQAPPAVAAASTPRFADQIRPDFFAGLMGDQTRFQRAMGICEAALAKDPKNAEAMVWHGAGVLVRSAQHLRDQDLPLAEQFLQPGIEEMDRAAALAPDNPSVLTPQGATLFSVSQTPIPADLSKRLLQKAVRAYENVLKIHGSNFANLPLHARGEVLSGLADGWHRLGDDEQSHGYHLRVINECAGSSFAKNSEMWLNHQLPAEWHPRCHDCHLH